MLHEYHVMSLYIQRSVLSAVSCNRGRSWNVLPAETGNRLYMSLRIFRFIIPVVFLCKWWLVGPSKSRSYDSCVLTDPPTIMSLRFEVLTFCPHAVSQSHRYVKQPAYYYFSLCNEREVSTLLPVLKPWPLQIESYFWVAARLILLSRFLGILFT
jgi:hypothetical protein